MLECERFVYRLCTPLQCAIHTCETCFNCNYRTRSYLHIFRSRYSFSLRLLYPFLRTETLFNVTPANLIAQFFRNAERIPLCRWLFFSIRERARSQLKWFSMKHKQNWKLTCPIDAERRQCWPLGGPAITIKWSQARALTIYLLIYEICIHIVTGNQKHVRSYLTSCGENSFIFRRNFNGKKIAYQCQMRTSEIQRRWDICYCLP